MAMKALKMRDSDLVKVYMGYKSENGTISSFDMSAITKLTKCLDDRPPCVKYDLQFEHVRTQEALMETVYEDGRVIVTLTNEQADKLLCNDVAVMIATLKVGFDKLCEASSQMDNDDRLSHLRCSVEDRLSNMLRMIAPK